MNMTIPTVLAVSAALILAPAAHTDPTDDQNYLGELKAFGFTPTVLGLSPWREIAMGKAICGDLKSGTSANVLVSALQKDFPNLTKQNVQDVILVAVSNYCPDVTLPWIPYDKVK
jgi:hypothetical protein